MDGRMFRKLCVFGCLAVAGTGIGCRNSKSQQQSQMIGPMPVDTQKIVNMPVGGSPNTKTSFWGGLKGNSNKTANSTPNANAPVATMPVEVVKAEDEKKPAAASTIVAIADVQLDAAFDEKTAAGSKEGLLDMARKGYQKALQQEPKSKDALLGMARFYAKTNERDKSVEQYKKCLTIYPKDAEVGHEVAMQHARWKDWAGAVAWCEYTLKNIDPENRSVKKTMGFCQAMLGQWDAAFATLSQIMPEAQARHNLAGLLDQLGHTEACKAQLQMALKADPNYVPSAGFLAELQQPRSRSEGLQATGGVQE